MDNWQHYAERLAALFGAVAMTDRTGAPLDVDGGFARWCDWARDVGRGRRAVYLIGNGASASMAGHFAADLAKNARLHTQVFFDPSLVTAISNDLGYEHVFAVPLRRCGREGDLLVAISSSGRSPNILAAADVARQARMRIVTLTGMAPDNPLRALGDLNVHVPGESYGLVETSHAAVLHWWMDLVQQAGADGAW